jgi:hypothetical protein
VSLLGLQLPALEEIERVPEVGTRLEMAGATRGTLARAYRELDRFTPLCGAREVYGEQIRAFAERVSKALRDDTGNAPMQLLTATRRNAFIDGVAQESMAKDQRTLGAAAFLDDEPRDREPPEPRLELVGLEVRELLQDPEDRFLAKHPEDVCRLARSAQHFQAPIERLDERTRRIQQPIPRAVFEPERLGHGERQLLQ